MPLLFKTVNSATASLVAPAGICNGMTAAWARFSLQNGGCTANDKTAIEAGGLLLATKVRLKSTELVETPVMVAAKWKKMLATVGLESQYRTTAIFTGDTLAAGLLGYGSETSYIVITCAAGVHAIGARTTPTTCDFFDPNVGLQRDDTNVAFTAGVGLTMAAYAGWTAIPTHIFTLQATA